MVDESRRSFLNVFFVKNPVRLVTEAYESYQNNENDLNYFESYESAYTLISENMPFLEDEAKRLGIDMTNKSNLEIVKEIYDKNNQNKKG